MGNDSPSSSDMHGPAPNEQWEVVASEMGWLSRLQLIRRGRGSAQAHSSGSYYESQALEIKSSLLMRAAWNKSLRADHRQAMYFSAETQFRRILNVDPKCFTALAGLGQIFGKRDANYFDAIRLYDRALDIRKNCEVLMFKAASLFDWGNKAGAQACLDQAYTGRNRQGESRTANRHAGGLVRCTEYAGLHRQVAGSARATPNHFYVNRDNCLLQSAP